MSGVVRCAAAVAGGAALAGLGRAVARDYRAWIALGPGGLPANGLGWMATTALRPLKRETLSTPRYRRPGVERTAALPPRRGPRPTLAPHPIPHRQLDQVPPRAIIERTQAAVSDLAADHANRLHLGRSLFERRGDALFASDPEHHCPWLRGSRGEVGHAHPSDGSLHVVFRAAHAARVIEAGWGERHPLSGRWPLGLPDTYLLVYAPRDDGELVVVTELLRLASGLDDGARPRATTRHLTEFQNLCWLE